MTQKCYLGSWRRATEQTRQHRIEGRIEIGTGRFDDLNQAIAAYRTLTNPLTIVLLRQSFQKLESSLHFYTDLQRRGISLRNIDVHRHSIGYVAEVVAWLALSRLYLVSTQDALSHRSGGDHESDVARFVAVTNDAFDTLAGYRFMYNLRDYAQHCGPPASGLRSVVTPDGQQFELTLSKSGLLAARFNWSKHARELLASWEDEFSLLPLMKEAMDGYNRIDRVVVLLDMERCGRSIEILRLALDDLGEADGIPGIFRLPADDSDEQPMQMNYLPPKDELDRIEAALTTADPVAQFDFDDVPPIGVDENYLASRLRGAAVMAAWLSQPDESVLERAINDILERDGNVSPLVAGLMNVCGELLAMVSQLINCSPEYLLRPPE